MLLNYSRHAIGFTIFTKNSLNYYINDIKILSIQFIAIKSENTLCFTSVLIVQTDFNILFHAHNPIKMQRTLKY